MIQRRLTFLIGVFVLALGAAVLRAGWLASVQAGELSKRAREQQLAQTTVYGQRGTISDRNGVQLAVSEDATTVYADPQVIADPESVAGKLTPLLGDPQPVVFSELADRSRGFVYLKRQIDPVVGQQIQRLNIEGIGTMPEPRRWYPQGSVASQLLGVVGTDGAGLFGLEQSHNRDLAGKPGQQLIVKDAFGKPARVIDKKQPQPGRDLQLTIDEPIQARTDSVLADVASRYRPQGATAIVMDPTTGEILALANWPSADANNFTNAPDAARSDRAVQTTFEPGSTFKPFTVAGALSERLITPQTPFNLAPTINVGGDTIKEAHGRPTEVLNTGQILAQSSNVGGVTIGLLLGPQRLDSWIRRFGFGQRTHVDLPGEQSGIVLRPSQYSASAMGNIPIGQGVGITALQLAAGYEAFADGGLIHPPHVVVGPVPDGRRVIAPQTAGQISQMLQGVLGENGTAPEAAVAGYQVAGKTGTAQEPDGHGGYSQTKYVASFVGFAPVNNPRLLVAIAVDEPQGDIYGGSVAAPAFEQIMSFALPYLRIPPG